MEVRNCWGIVLFKWIGSKSFSIRGRNLLFRARRWFYTKSLGEGISTKRMSYVRYISLQKKKTEDPARRRKWLEEEWAPKIREFSGQFSRIFQEMAFRPENGLLVGARTGQEVQALRDMGIAAVGVDLVPSGDLVVEGDMHHLPFSDKSFDFVFSNCFDHSLFPTVMIEEMERVVRPGGLIALHLQLNKPDDSFGVTDLYSLQSIKVMFGKSLIVGEKPLVPAALSMNYELIARRE